MSSVRAFCDRSAESASKIDMLVHNAGIASPPQNISNTSPDGKDLVILTNFLGSFLMTKLLEPHLSPTARIVMTSSTGHLASDLILQPPQPPSQSLRFKSFQADEAVPRLARDAAVSSAYRRGCVRRRRTPSLVDGPGIMDRGGPRGSNSSCGGVAAGGGVVATLARGGVLSCDVVARMASMADLLNVSMVCLAASRSASAAFLTRSSMAVMTAGSTAASTWLFKF